LPSKRLVLTNLTNACVTEIAGMLAPRPVAVDVKLASAGWFQKGGSLVKDGIQYAEKGEWRSAEAAWQAAIELDPQNHAALHNLGVAHEARHDYSQADKYLQDANQIRPHTMYVSSASRARLASSDYARTQQQRSARVAQAPQQPIETSVPPAGAPQTVRVSHQAAPPQNAFPPQR
ncbi:MAG: tetratricopeptide repeat protein, partial [Planctomycetales bacterium]